jgi:hypothetical protein
MRGSTQDLREIGIHSRDRWTSKAAGQVAVLTMSRAALCQIKPPIRARRNGLQTQLGRRSNNDRKRVLGISIDVPRILAGRDRETVGLQAHDLATQDLGAGEHGVAVLPLQSGRCDEHALRSPELRSRQVDHILGMLIG